MKINISKFNIFPIVVKFLKESRQELKKVTWPTRQETIKYTMIIIGISFTLTVFLGGMDYFFMFLLSKFL